MLKTINLYGVLGEKFGRQYKLEVANPREAIRALSVLVDGFEKFMLRAHEHGLTFALITNRKIKGRGKKVPQFYDKESKRTIKGLSLAEPEIDMSLDSNEIHIVPRVIGSGGGGLLQTILGVALIGTGLFAPFGLIGGVFGALTLVGTGAGLLMGGITQMLMPKVADMQNQNQDGNKANNGFGSAVTTMPQGNPYPLLIGERLVGGVVLSAGQYPENV